MSNSLSMKITWTNLLKYALPTIMSGIFMNIYTLVDSLFISNLIGTDGLSATNIAGPFLAIALALGTMLATGGCALVTKQLGEGKERTARENFTFFVVLSLGISLIFCILGILFRQPILTAMGADVSLYSMCESYAIPLFITIPFAMVSIIMQIFFVAAGKPMMSFVLSVSGGIINIILDYVLLAVIPMGIAGAAVATTAGYVFQALIGIGYFAFNRKGSLYFVKPVCRTKDLMKALANGMSEMVSMLAISVTMIFTNVIMMRIVGSDGVAATAIVLSAQTILSAFYMGYLEAIAPIISFNYGAGNTDNLKKIYRVVLCMLAVMSAITFFATFPLARPIVDIYAKGVVSVSEYAMQGIRIYAVAFLFMGFNMFASSMFTAFNNGKISAIISFCRTFVFLMIPLAILPSVCGITGVWLAMPTAEILSIIVSAYFMKKKKATYQYA